MNRLISPSTDFRAVRDGRNSQVFYVDVALDSARSAAAGTGLVLPISGNSFYIDANPMDGNAFVHFQDTNFDRGPVPLYVSPGTIFNIPYTQILLENTAQPGKKIRIAYGIDVDFQPGSVSQIAVTNAGGYTAVRPEIATGFFSDISSLVANTPLTVFAPGANANGAVLLSADINDVNSVGSIQVFIHKASAPASVTDGAVLLQAKTSALPSASASLAGRSEYPQYIPAGQGLYFISSAISPSGVYSMRSCRYKLL